MSKSTNPPQRFKTHSLRPGWSLNRQVHSAAKSQLHFRNSSKHMTNQKTNTAFSKAILLAGAFSLIAVSVSSAALTPVAYGTPDPGPAPVVLGAPDNTGTYVTSVDSVFSTTDGSGNVLSETLRTIVVSRTSGPAGLDFYYQLINNSSPLALGIDSDIFRLAIEGGFVGSTITVGNISSLTGITGLPGGYVAGANISNAADFGGVAQGQVLEGTVGFDFSTTPLPPFGTNPLDLEAGESTPFLVVHTDSTTFAAASASAYGGFSSLNSPALSTFAAVPEPGSILFGLAMFGVTLNSRVRSRTTKATDRK